MLRAKSLLLFISSILILISCSETTTDPGDSGEGEESIEPAVSVSNPGDGSVLDGEITLAIDGESESGFDEARIFVGDEQIETVESPSLPYEQTIATYDYNNGDYDISAELDVAEEDTTIEASVSVTLENYMVTLETDGYIEMLNENNDAAYMFIADPGGNVLREIELTAKTDGTIKLLPPSTIEGEAPEYYSVTIGKKTTDYQNNDAFYLDTDAGLPSWSTLNMSGSVSSGSDEESTYTDLTVEVNNFNQEPLLTYFFMEDDRGYRYDSESHTGDLTHTISLPTESNDLFITHLPNWNTVEDPVPVYRWEENPTELKSPVSYNAADDFTQMQSQAVSNTSNIEINNYLIWMTIAPDSYEDGDMPILIGNPSWLGDANGSDAGFGIWTPQISDRSFITYMNAVDQSNSDVYHRFQTSVMDGFPDEFYIVDAEVQVNNQSLDNLEMDITGSADFIRFSADASTDNYTQSWSVSLPDTSSSFVFPHIADSLDSSVNNYNRSEFEINYVNSVDYGKFDNGYSSYLEWQYGTTDFGVFVEWANRSKNLSTDNSKEKPSIPEMRQSADIKTPNEVHFK